MKNADFKTINNRISPFFCIQFLLPPHNLERKKTKLVLFRTLQNYPLLNSRIKRYKKSFGFIFYIGLRAPIKNIKQNIGEESIVQCWFYETIIKKFN